MSITPEELAILERTRGAQWSRVGHYAMIWQRAADEYNTDHPTERPMKWNCRPCLFKIYQYLKTKSCQGASL